MRAKTTWLGAAATAVLGFVWLALEIFGPKEWSTLWWAVSFIVAAVITIGAFARENHALRQRLDERDLRHAIARRLGRFLTEADGEKLQSLDRIHPPEIISAFDRRVEAYLMEEPRLGEDYVARYRTGAGIPITIPEFLREKHKRQWCHMHTRRARLGEFIKDFRADSGDGKA